MSTGEPREVQLGTAKVTFPSNYLQQLQDSNHLLGDRGALWDELNDKGYLFIRKLHDPDDIWKARLATLDHIQKCGPNKLDSEHPWQSGILDSRCGKGCIPMMEGNRSITHHDHVAAVLEGQRPKEFFKMMFGEEPLTFDYKWLRGVHTTAYTGAHVDRVYMGRGTEELLTMWTPMDSVQVEMGTLAVCEGSHRLESFNLLQETYGNCDIEKERLQGTGWFTHDPLEITRRFGGQWKTSDFEAGDVLIFTIRTVHMSTVNLTNKVRLSCDTRWQPASEPVDTRFMGNNVYEGVIAPDDEPTTSGYVSIEHLKERWGFN